MCGFEEGLCCVCVGLYTVLMLEFVSFDEVVVIIIVVLVKFTP